MLNSFVFVFLEIGQYARDLQSRNKATDNIAEQDRIGLGESGNFDVDIYGGNNRLDGYVDSIAPNEDDEVSEKETCLNCLIAF